MLATRISVARRLPSLFAARGYSTGRSEGSVAQSQGFNKKEKAHEDQYVRQHEQQLIQKMKADIAKKQAELEDLQKQHSELEKKKD
ncbi:hypothetical protein BDQ12DRAFT_724039 [Crucibulum laeve]|uniref:ATPase inhibitor, mitochondrial n=1 Tax=Crucibulum laeve TaxID=68775 RepID=A0A5C3LZQ5_9AGAR|nr:hypothetical protein BDQ12DRAFT_724039 [Crucibulum laeve]